MKLIITGNLHSFGLCFQWLNCKIDFRQHVSFWAVSAMCINKFCIGSFAINVIAGFVGDDSFNQGKLLLRMSVLKLYFQILIFYRGSCIMIFMFGIAG